MERGETQKAITCPTFVLFDLAPKAGVMAAGKIKQDSIVSADWSAILEGLDNPFERTSTDLCVEVAYPRTADPECSHRNDTCTQ